MPAAIPANRPIRRSKLKRWRRRLRPYFFRALFAAVLLAILLGALSIVSWLPFFGIRSVAVEGSRTVPAAELEEIVLGALSGGYGKFLFARRNILIYPKREVEAALRAAFPRLEEVELSRAGRQALSLRVSERSPAALWCEGGPDQGGLEREEKPLVCRYADASGYIYAPAPSFSGPVFFTYYDARGPSAGAALGATGTLNAAASGTAAASQASTSPLGTRILDEAELGRIALIRFKLEAAGLETLGLAILPDGDRGFILKQGGTILFTQMSDPDKLVLDAATVFSSAEFLEKLEEAGGPLDYIDFRFDGRIYYRFKRQ